MAITTAVIALETDQEFRQYVKLHFIQAADWILSGNFPASVTTDADKDKVTQYASDVYRGNGNVNAQVLMVLAQTAIQDKINTPDLPGAYSIMQTQIRLNLKNIAGVVPVYSQ